MGSYSHLKFFEQNGATQVRQESINASNIQTFLQRVGSNSDINLQIAGAKLREVENNPDGTFDLTKLKSQIQNRESSEPQTILLFVENTHMALGGKIIPLKWLDEVR